MRIVVTVKTRARAEKIEKIDDGHYRLAVKAAPQAGQANEAVCKLVAKYLRVAPSRVHIKLGKTSKEKLLEII